jgi:hypothetical protein
VTAPGDIISFYPLQQLHYIVVTKFEMAQSTAAADLRSMFLQSFCSCFKVLFSLDVSGLLVVPVVDMLRPVVSPILSNTAELMNRMLIAVRHANI